MRTLPLFVPVGVDQVATVLTVPDGKAKGLVAVLAGIGRHHVVGGTFAGRLAETLAEHGFATARFDYTGVGDSPGEVTSWSPASCSAAASQAAAVVELSQRALGVEDFAVVGTCYGSRVALALLESPQCLGAVCLAPPLLDPSGKLSVEESGLHERPGKHKAIIDRVLGRVRTSPRSARRSGAVSAALQQLDRKSITFLYGADAEADHLGRRARATIDKIVGSLDDERRSRFELQILETGPLTTFDGLAVAEQADIVTSVVPRVLGCFRR